ncbi:pseudouridine synthase [Flaviaesturariibacter terrae]
MNKKSGFEKFHKGGPKKGAALKEQLRQEKKAQTRERKAFFEQQRADKAAARSASFGSEPAPRTGRPGRPSVDKPTRAGSEKPARAGASRPERPGSDRPAKGAKVARPAAAGSRPAPSRAATGNEPSRQVKLKGVVEGKPLERKASSEQMPLNKFLAHGGICGRREAADIVKSGKVQVNGAVVKEPGFKVQASDDVRFGGKRVVPSRNLVYILLNKPKDYLTTTDDPQQRKTVLDLIGAATDERVYPVGRLDRNTSGVLLLTNDGELAQKLTHPSNEIKKVYAVTLDKPLTKAHFDEILRGTPLEDGLASVDSLAYADGTKKEIGIEIHSGRNRVVRRIFEHFGYDVKNLDRVIFAGLTKKNVPRGKWRFLNEKEVRDLKFFKRGKK